MKFDIQKTKVQLVIQHSFFGNLMHHLQFKADSGIPTAATNGNSVLYNPSFMDKLTARQHLFVLAHEISHVAFEHVIRFTRLMNTGSSITNKTYNMAADYLINDLLVNECGMEGIGGMLINHEYKFMDWTVEELCRELEESGQNSSGCSDGFGQGNDMLPGEGKSESELKDQEVKWKVAVAQAAEVVKQSKGRGSLPGWLTKLVDDILNPKIDWRKELLDWANTTVISENSWNRPNRRFIGMGKYFPGKDRNPSINTLVIGLDTSGSMMGPDDLRICCSEINHLIEQLKPSKVYVLHIDTSVRHVDEFNYESYPIKLEAKGGGGTCFEPAFDWIKENLNDDEVDGLIYMTDMCGSFPDTAPQYPVFWLATSDIKPPFGQYAKYNG